MPKIASKPPEARKRQGRIPLWISEGPWHCQNLDFGFPPSRNVRQQISIILSHPVCGSLLWQPYEINAGILSVFFNYLSIATSKLVTGCQNSKWPSSALDPRWRQLSELNVSQGSFGIPILKEFWMVFKHCLLKQTALLMDTKEGLVTQMCPTLCNPMDYIACQAPLSMEFSRQEYWSGLPFPTPEDLPDPGIEPMSLASPALAGRFFTTVPPGSPTIISNLHDKGIRNEENKNIF